MPRNKIHTAKRAKVAPGGLDKVIRIYLAGPDVFLRDAVAIGGQKKALCKKYGFEGVYPFDAEADMAELPKMEAGIQIGLMNEKLISDCHAVIANLTPFRGPSADVGTAYEMGFARAAGLIVFGYTNKSAGFKTRTLRWLGQSARKEAGNRFRDSNDMAVEDWGMVDNLMLHACILSSGGSLIVHNAPQAKMFTDLTAFETCLQKLRNP